MSLREQGFRFLISQGKNDFRWVHPAEVSGFAGWTDVTDMDDAQFLAFVIGA